MLELNLYGNPSGTYYYLDGLMTYMKKRACKINERELCLVRMQTQNGAVILVIAVDDFLAAAESLQAIDDAYSFLNARYRVKIIGRPTRYLSWYFHFLPEGGITLSQRLLEEKTLKEVGMSNANGKLTPYPDIT